MSEKQGGDGMGHLEVVKATLARRRAGQPSLAAQWRAGREDLFKTALKAFPDSPEMSREMGQPGVPTPQQVTDGLEGRDGATVHGKAEPPQKEQEQQQRQEPQQQQRRGRGR